MNALTPGHYRVEGTIEVTDNGPDGSVYVVFEAGGLPRFLSKANTLGLEWSPVGAE